MKKVRTIILLFVIACFISCASKTESTQEENTSYTSYPTSSLSESENTAEDTNDVKDDENDEEDENEEAEKWYSSICKFEDGEYSAMVDYNNPETGYSATYTLQVEVQDCQVVQINFPNDGYLDEDHISMADLDEDGNATVEGEDGKTYEIQIDD